MLDHLIKTRSAHDLGHRVPVFNLKGAHPGLRLVVTGPADLLRDVADMLWNKRELAAIHGSLMLRPDDQDISLDRPDETLSVTGDEQAAFERILGRMLAVGMIPTLIADAA